MNNSSTPREPADPQTLSQRDDAARHWLLSSSEMPFSTPAGGAAAHKSALDTPLANFDLEHLQQSPWILCALAQNGLETDPHTALLYSECAYRRFKQLDDRAGQCFAWSGIIFGHVMAGNDLRLLDQWLDALDDIYAYRPESRDPVCDVRVTQALAIALLHRGIATPQHAIWIERTASVLHTSFDHDHRIALGTYLGLYAICAGDLVEAAGIMAALNAAAANDTLAPITRALWYVFSALFGWITGDTQASKRAVESGLAAATGKKVFSVENWLLLQGGYACILEGDIAGARSYLRRSEAMQSQTNHLRSVWYGLLQALVHLAEQDLTRAEVHARLTLINATRQHSQLNRSIALACLACVLLEKGDSTQAQRCVDSALGVRDVMFSCAASYLWACIEACIAQQTGRTGPMLESLRHAFRIDKSMGGITLPCLTPRALGQLYSAALRENIEVEHIQGLIRRNPWIKDRLAPDILPWPWKPPIGIPPVGNWESQ